jgi:hypothetical protein
VAPTRLSYISSFVIGGTNWITEWFVRDDADMKKVDEAVQAYTDLAMATILGGAKPAGD